MTNYSNPDTTPVETKLNQSNMTYSTVAVPAGTHPNMIFPNSRVLPIAQHILPQHSTVYTNGDLIGPTTVDSNHLGMIPPTQIYQNQILTQVCPVVAQPQDLFKTSYIYNKNIPLDNTFCNVTTPYNYISNQNRLSRVLPPPETSRVNSFYRSNSNINSGLSSISSNNSICSTRSDSTLIEHPIPFQHKYSTTSLNSVSYAIEAPIFNSETKINNNNNQTFITSLTPPRTVTPIGNMTPMSFASTASSPVTGQCNKLLEQQGQRRHSISTTHPANNEENIENKALDNHHIYQKNLQPNPTSINNINTNNKITKPSASKGNHDYEGKLIGSSGKPLKDTKRAAQNRCAQKAFRLRNKRYIEELKEKAKNFDKIMEENEKLKKTIELLKQDKNLILE
ncbi:hypothetical protein MOSE0_M07646 [Monosporozyma servazzii]